VQISRALESIHTDVLATGCNSQLDHARRGSDSPGVTERSALIDQLRRQLNFIITSCHAYDAGHRAEAVRIALAARVLFHDTSRSTSLIVGHLKLDAIKLRSTAVPLTGPNASAIGFIGLEPDTCGFRPLGDDGLRSEQVDLSTWWSDEPILKLRKTNEFVTRRELVLAAANRDGGAHVDANRPKEYDRLEAGLGFQVEVGYANGERKIITFRYANLAALRQVGHEILTSEELIKLAA
jgi:hypothetical protein